MVRPHPPLSRKPPGSHAPTTQLSELKASVEADGHLQRKAGSPGSRCRRVHQMAGGGPEFGDPWRCDWDAVGMTFAGGEGSVTGMTVGVGGVKYSSKMLDQEDLGGKEDLGRRASSAAHRAAWGMEWGGAVGAPPFPLPPLSPPPSFTPSLLPSYSPPLLLSLSGSLVLASGCSDSQSSTQLLQGPWREGVQPSTSCHTSIYPHRVWPGSTLYQEHPL